MISSSFGSFWESWNRFSVVWRTSSPNRRTKILWNCKKIVTGMKAGETISDFYFMLFMQISFWTYSASGQIGTFRFFSLSLSSSDSSCSSSSFPLIKHESSWVDGSVGFVHVRIVIVGRMYVLFLPSSKVRVPESSSSFDLFKGWCGLSHRSCLLNGYYLFFSCHFVGK